MHALLRLCLYLYRLLSTNFLITRYYLAITLFLRYRARRATGPRTSSALLMLPKQSSDMRTGGRTYELIPHIVVLPY